MIYPDLLVVTKVTSFFNSSSHGKYMYRLAAPQATVFLVVAFFKIDMIQNETNIYNTYSIFQNNQAFFSNCKSSFPLA